MKRNILLTLGIMVIFGLNLTGFVSAQSSATTIREFDCGINAEDSGIPALLITTNTWAVITSSGNTDFHCLFTIPVQLQPARPMIHTDFLCSTQAGVTLKSQTITTYSSVHLICQINPSTAPYEPPPGD